MVNIKTALLIAFIMLSVISALEVMEDEDFNNLIFREIENKTGVDRTKGVMRQTGYFALFSQSLNNIVPTYRYNLPFYKGHIVGINDIPYFDGTDLFILLPLLYLPYKFYDRKKKQLKILERLLLLFGFIILTIILWLLTKQIVYQIYLFSASQLGIEALAIPIREGFIQNVEGSKKILLGISFVTGLIIFSSIKKKK